MVSRTCEVIFPATAAKTMNCSFPNATESGNGLLVIRAQILLAACIVVGDARCRCLKVQKWEGRMTRTMFETSPLAMYFPEAINCLICATAKSILASVNIFPISRVALV